MQRDQKVFSILNGKKMREVNEFGYYQTAFPSFLISDDLMWSMLDGDMQRMVSSFNVNFKLG